MSFVILVKLLHVQHHVNQALVYRALPDFYSQILILAPKDEVSVRMWRSSWFRANVLHSTLPPNLKYEGHEFNIHSCSLFKWCIWIEKAHPTTCVLYLRGCSVDDGVSAGQFVDVSRVSSSNNSSDRNTSAHHCLHHVQISLVQPWETLTVIHKLEVEVLGCQSYHSPWSVRRSRPSSSSQWGSTPASYRTRSGRKVSSSQGRWASTVDHQTCYSLQQFYVVIHLALASSKIRDLVTWLC